MGKHLTENGEEGSEKMYVRENERKINVLTDN